MASPIVSLGCANQDPITQVTYHSTDWSQEGAVYPGAFAAMAAYNHATTPPFTPPATASTVSSALGNPLQNTIWTAFPC